MARSAILSLLASVSTVYAYGRWGDDYDGDGPNYGDIYGPGGDDGGRFGSGIGIDYAVASRYRTIHGSLAALAFVALFPIGAILLRVVPGRFSYLVHGLVQPVAFVAYICGAALGIYLVRMVRIQPNGQSLLSIPSANAHPIIGIIILVVLFFQPALGWVHHIRYKRLGCRSFWSYAHIWVGRLAITLGIINGGLGLGLAQAGRSAIAAYSAIAVIMWLLWVAATFYEERRRQKTVVAAAGFGGKSLDGRGPSPPYTPGAMYGGLPPSRDDRMWGMEMGAVKHGHRGSSASSLSLYSRR